MASPENSADPATPSRNAIVVRCPSARWASAFSDRMPPSPLLSACIRNRTYFAVTTISSAQMMRETTPTTSAGAERRVLQLAESGLQRVKRARSDVAEDHADRAEREDPKAAGRGVAVRGFGRSVSRAERPPARGVGTCRRASRGAGGGRTPGKTARVYTLPRTAREGPGCPPPCASIFKATARSRIRRGPFGVLGQVAGKRPQAFRYSARGPRPGRSRTGRL